MARIRGRALSSSTNHVEGIRPSARGSHSTVLLGESQVVYPASVPIGVGPTLGHGWPDT